MPAERGEEAVRRLLKRRLMSQIFPKSANAWSKGSIFLVAGIVVSLGALLPVLQRSDFVTTA
ncbi:MAG TPA: hypothetical protein VMW48_20375, partial [Vicinamibacterales bacterium]|nr:hypothetical protein [Vicinamibacterales bacterium]